MSADAVSHNLVVVAKRLERAKQPPILIKPARHLAPGEKSAKEKLLDWALARDAIAKIEKHGLKKLADLLDVDEDRLRRVIPEVQMILQEKGQSQIKIEIRKHKTGTVDPAKKIYEWAVGRDSEESRKKWTFKQIAKLTSMHAATVSTHIDTVQELLREKHKPLIKIKSDNYKEPVRSPQESLYQWAVARTEEEVKKKWTFKQIAGKAKIHWKTISRNFDAVENRLKREKLPPILLATKRYKPAVKDARSVFLTWAISVTQQGLVHEQRKIAKLLGISVTAVKTNLKYVQKHLAAQELPALRLRKRKHEEPVSVAPAKDQLSGREWLLKEDNGKRFFETLKGAQETAIFSSCGDTYADIAKETNLPFVEIERYVRSGLTRIKLEFGIDLDFYTARSLYKKAVKRNNNNGGKTNRPLNSANNLRIRNIAANGSSSPVRAEPDSGSNILLPKTIPDGLLLKYGVYSIRELAVIYRAMLNKNRSKEDRELLYKYYVVTGRIIDIMPVMAALEQKDEFPGYCYGSSVHYRDGLMPEWLKLRDFCRGHVQKVIEGAALGKRDMVLDLGCGEACDSIEVAKRYPKARVVGVDLDPQNIHFIMNGLRYTPLNNFSLLMRDFRNRLPIKDGQVKLLLMLGDVLYGYGSDWVEAVLSEVFRLANKNNSTIIFFGQAGIHRIVDKAQEQRFKDITPKNLTGVVVRAKWADLYLRAFQAGFNPSLKEISSPAKNLNKGGNRGISDGASSPLTLGGVRERLVRFSAKMDLTRPKFDLQARPEDLIPLREIRRSLTRRHIRGQLKIDTLYWQEDKIGIDLWHEYDPGCESLASVVIEPSNILVISGEEPDIYFPELEEIICNDNSGYFQKGKGGSKQWVWYNLNWMASITYFKLSDKLRNRCIGGTWYTSYIEPYLAHCGFQNAAVIGKCLDDLYVRAFWRRLGFTQRFHYDTRYEYPVPAVQYYISAKRLTPEVSSSPAINGNGDDPQEIINFVNRARQELNRLFPFDGPAVSIFGSARVLPASAVYHQAKRTGRELARKGITVITGGGPGIMEGANRGAAEVDPALSLGLRIKLPFEQGTNRFVNEMLFYRLFFTRKLGFINHSRGFICFDGGFGTLDELFEAATLKDRNLVGDYPLILAGDFYTGLKKLIERMGKWGFLRRNPGELFNFVRKEKEILPYFNRAYKKPKPFIDVKEALLGLTEALLSLNNLGPSVSVLGSGRINTGSPYFAMAREIARLLTRENITVIYRG
ncbi:MAG: LOG family protein, partial [Candidatus Omnitrophica bacterium]|nr:LOG family protein [Candidatus Omnitrophota bacterium]